MRSRGRRWRRRRLERFELDDVHRAVPCSAVPDVRAAHRHLRQPVQPIEIIEPRERPAKLAAWRKDDRPDAVANHRVALRASVLAQRHDVHRASVRTHPVRANGNLDVPVRIQSAQNRDGIPGSRLIRRANRPVTALGTPDDLVIVSIWTRIIDQTCASRPVAPHEARCDGTAPFACVRNARIASRSF